MLNEAIIAAKSQDNKNDAVLKLRVQRSVKNDFTNNNTTTNENNEKQFYKVQNFTQYKRNKVDEKDYHKTLLVEGITELCKNLVYYITI